MYHTFYGFYQIRNVIHPSTQHSFTALQNSLASPVYPSPPPNSKPFPTTDLFTFIHSFNKLQNIILFR